MPRTIEEGFGDFLTKLTPTTTENVATKNHRASIEACLKANFGLKRFFRTGSLGNGTSISGYSDTDYFASIPTENLKENSNLSLAHIKGCLDKRFPNTGVRVSCPAVRVPFGTLAVATTEIVPADFIEKTRDGHHIYEIPDCNGGWMFSSPDIHNAYVRHVNERYDNKLKPLIRFIKAWKYYKNVPISSFYLELFITKYVEGEQTIIYEIDIDNIFNLLDDENISAIQDPCNISGFIEPCTTVQKKNVAKLKLKTAKARAAKASEANSNGNTKGAFHWLNLLFDEKFPGYYR